MDSQLLKYNKYLHQLSSFPDIAFILDNLIVPTSVVFTWNRLSLVLKGIPYDSFDWKNVSGCDVDGDFSIRKEDISSLMLSTTTEGEFTTANLMHGFSFNPLPENYYYLITTLSRDYEKDAIESEEIRNPSLLNPTFNSISKENAYTKKYRPVISRMPESSMQMISEVVLSDSDSELSAHEDYSDVSSLQSPRINPRIHHIKNQSSMSIARGENEGIIYPTMNIRTPSSVIRGQRSNSSHFHNKNSSFAIMSKRMVEEYSSTEGRSPRNS